MLQNGTSSEAPINDLHDLRLFSLMINNLRMGYTGITMRQYLVTFCNLPIFPPRRHMKTTPQHQTLYPSSTAAKASSFELTVRASTHFYAASCCTVSCPTDKFLTFPATDCARYQIVHLKTGSGHQHCASSCRQPSRWRWLCISSCWAVSKGWLCSLSLNVSWLTRGRSRKTLSTQRPFHLPLPSSSYMAMTKLPAHQHHQDLCKAPTKCSGSCTRYDCSIQSQNSYCTALQFMHPVPYRLKMGYLRCKPSSCLHSEQITPLVPPTSLKICVHPDQQKHYVDSQTLDQSPIATVPVCADFRGELQALNRELLFQYITAVQSLCDNPSNYSRMVESVGDIARNMHYLLNILRPYQVGHALQACMVTGALGFDFPVSAGTSNPATYAAGGDC